MAISYSRLYFRIPKYKSSYLVLASISYLTNASHQVQMIMVYGMLAFAIYNYVSYVTKISRQMANILGIRIFHIKPQI